MFPRERSAASFLTLSLAVAFAGIAFENLSGAESAGRILQWFEKERPLIGELMNGARFAQELPGLAPDTLAAMQRLEAEGYKRLRAGYSGEASRKFYHIMAMGLGRPRR